MILTITRAYLFIIGLFFYVIFGLLFILDPAAMFEQMNITFGSAMAVEEVRASHGGVWLMTGLVCLAAVWRPTLVRHVLVYLLIFNGGYAVGRIVSFLFGNVPASELLPLFLFDVVLVVISVVLLRQGAGSLAARS